MHAELDKEGSGFKRVPQNTVIIEEIPNLRRGTYLYNEDSENY